MIFTQTEMCEALALVQKEYRARKKQKQRNEEVTPYTRTPKIRAIMAQLQREKRAKKEYRKITKIHNFNKKNKQYDDELKEKKK